jgi:hypothetical protein
VRRGRLPEPGEILFCTLTTSLEDVELLLMRYFHAKTTGRGEFIFCVADIHALSYALQCSVVERLRAMCGTYGMGGAASLFFVSGKPRQVILNSLSDKLIDLPALDIATLQASMAVACRMHCGETTCVVSDINGGGKTHLILRAVGQRQWDGMDVYYHRIPFRESSNAASLVTLLSNYPVYERSVFHLDIGHIIPSSANTNLFELLVVGVLKNQQSGRVYHRHAGDVYMIELPNSREDRTVKALRFCSLLPQVRSQVSADSLDLTRPIFTDSLCRCVSNADYDELLYVCKFLRGYRLGKFRPGASFDAEFNVWTEPEISQEECFELMTTYTASDDDAQPSYLIFHSFLCFMYAGFKGMESFPLLSGLVVQFTQGLEMLREVFARLLIETSQDFTLRAVPRGKQYGGGAKATEENQTARMLRQLPAHLAQEVEAEAAQRQEQQQQQQQRGTLASALAAVGQHQQQQQQQQQREDGLRLPSLRRTPSNRDQYEHLLYNVPPTLTRQLSNELAERFSAMKSWEDTAHPVVGSCCQCTT